MRLVLPHPDHHLQQVLSKELGISRLTAQVLINRGLADLGAAASFLRPDLRHLHDPFAFTAMRACVKRIQQAVSAGEQIMIYGDYDVDGITALAVLKKTIQAAGGKVCHYIPHRVKEGYGLNAAAIRQAKEKRCQLFITVDCGTNSDEHLRSLRALGIDVIITDHHEALPSAEHAGCLLLNPKQYEELALQVSAFYRQRYADAVIWQAEVFWKTWTLGFSYDLNISDFSVATNNRGGPEVSLSYRLYKFKTFKKYCPIDY